jgi:type IV pilus assembly protein PilY1
MASKFSLLSLRAVLSPRVVRGTFAAGLTALIGLAYVSPAAAQTTLADQPIAAGANIPGNLTLALSVEYPTAISVANIGSYADASTYLGYFDPLKCYTYVYNSTTPSSSYFQPAYLATGTYLHTCSTHMGQWSGNFMNWAAMQTIDPFRWALGGGYRSVDTTTQTILEKAWGTNQGSASANFNYRGTSQGSPNNLPSSLISAVTPFTSWGGFDMGVWGNGNQMVFSGAGTGYKTLVTATTGAPVDLSSITSANGSPNGPYKVYIRVDVCDATTSLGIAGLESNCVQYGSNYKPQGLMQQYSNKVEFSALGYLNQNGFDRQGGVLRKPMGFIGPTYPQPLSASVVTNTRAEWDPTTGIMSNNPDTASASSSGVTQSGALNYLNKFGESAHNYMQYDDVSELYYAAVRYYENLGNVPEWTNSLTTAEMDGFPALTTWTDPISYWCQKNFILGIGDDHTWYDYNVGGGVYSPTGGSRPKPAAVSSDTFNQAATWTTYMQNLEGITPTARWPFDTDATYFIAGLAYGVHVNDIRSDLQNAQTISTFWMDVEEGGGAENLNPYYLATKYGGFTPAASIPAAPTSTPYSMTTALTVGQWDTTGASIPMNGGNTHLLPDNYFLAGSANKMVAGLQAAFSSISNAITQATTAFSFSAVNVSTSGAESFQATFNSSVWSGTVVATTLTFDSSGNPVLNPLWSTATTLPTQFGGTGWQTGRNIVTWNGSAGVPFEPANIASPGTANNLTSAEVAGITFSASSYSPSTTPTQYLDYLRGDQTNEVGSTVSGSTKSLRKRTVLLGDIVDAALTPVTTPLQTFSDSNNPGYNAFKIQWTTTTPRPTMVYAGANDGILHGFLGSSGTEQFGYIPSALFQGPNNTPLVDGLEQLGNPAYSHHFYVDATPINYDIDLNHTYGSASTTPNWATLLIGGLGKGGKSFYALDVTDPASMTTESVVAGKVQWEFTDPTMGYSYGAPVVVKTVKYGWVAIFTSGYNNSDGYGYVYFVNPSSGALLEKVKTPNLSSGLTQASAFVMNYSDDTADSLYVGDLNGQLWRFDLTGTSGSYPQPTLLATLTDSSGNPQPVTTAPLIEIHPTTRKRYVMVGTGQLLAVTDEASTSMQSFYAIIDGTAGGFLPVPTPITRTNLTQLSATNLTGGAVISSSQGWFTDLGNDPTSGIAWRIILNPLAYNGIVVFTDLLTAVTDPCAPTGTSRIYALNYGTATSVLQSSTVPSTTVAYDSYTNQVINVRITGANGNPEIVAGFSSVATPPVVVPATLTGTLATRILNWRELPTAD